MAFAMMPDGKTKIDLTGASIIPAGNCKVAVLVEVGDKNANGTADVTVSPGVRLPLFGACPLPPVTKDVPIGKALEVMTHAAASTVGIPGADGVVDGMKSLVGHLEGLFQR